MRMGQPWRLLAVRTGVSDRLTPVSAEQFPVVRMSGLSCPPAQLPIRGAVGPVAAFVVAAAHRETPPGMGPSTDTAAPVQPVTDRPPVRFTRFEVNSKEQRS
jgi:hypothetical protein